LTTACLQPASSTLPFLDRGTTASRLRQLLWGAILPALLLVLAAFLFFYRLGDRELVSSHEARAAQNAQTMLDSGDWRLPRLFDRRVDLQKPPLYYWLVAAVAVLDGGRVTAWAVRLPAALAALGCVLLMWRLGAGRGRPVLGLVAALVLATALHFTWLARVGRIDMVLTFVVALAVVGFYHAHRQRCEQREGRTWPWLLAAYLALAAGIMLKGPIAIVLPGVVVVAFLTSPERKRGADLRAPRSRPGLVAERLHSLGLWWGIPLVVALTAPWYVWANVQTEGELFRVFFLQHNLARGFGGDETLAAHPWWFYGPRLVVDLLPWSLVLPLVAWQVWKGKLWREDAEVHLGLCWLLGILLLLSCMRFKRADYLLPAYPGFALLAGAAVERWVRSGLQVRRLALCLGVAAGGCALCWFTYLEWVVPRDQSQHACRLLAGEIRKQTSRPVLLFRVESHELAFHLGQPVRTLLEWENLDVWAGKAAATYVVMPADCAAEWRQHLRRGELELVLRSTDFRSHDGNSTEKARPVVVFRTRAY
jgi:4-amino-4-deoxy-L-arabinose transferase-like glycosyltransferase